MVLSFTVGGAVMDMLSIPKFIRGYVSSLQHTQHKGGATYDRAYDFL